jgi:hypothetical protein
MAARVDRVRIPRRRRAGTLAREESGAALIETIIVLPVMIVFLVGILEFGMLLFAKLQVETGLRDAARYLARCQPGFGCSQATARNIAVFGNIAGTGTARVEGWGIGDVTISAAAGLGLPVRVSTDFDYPGSPLISFIGLASINVTAFHEDRYIGF